MRSGSGLYKLPPICVAFRQSANQVSLGITVAATMRCKCACAHMPMVAHEHSVMCVTVIVTIWKAMTAPGVEPGLSRPQRDVLTTRRCGLKGGFEGWPYDVCSQDGHTAAARLVMPTIVAAAITSHPRIECAHQPRCGHGRHSSHILAPTQNQSAILMFHSDTLAIHNTE